VDPQQLRAHLDDLCQRLEQGRPLRVMAWAGTALVATAALVACQEEDDTAMVELYGAGPVEELVCDDAVDDDDDGLTDCDDPDCDDDPACADVGLYGAPEV
jgi:redox-regulated HSP33 family molecular chaperone